MSKTQMTGPELDKALKTISGAEKVENNGKILCIKDGKIALKDEEKQ